MTEIAVLELTVWKNEKFVLTEEIFRQINALVICLATVWKNTLKCDHNFCAKFRIFFVKLN